MPTSPEDHKHKASLFFAAVSEQDWEPIFARVGEGSFFRKVPEFPHFMTERSGLSTADRRMVAVFIINTTDFALSLSFQHSSAFVNHGGKGITGNSPAKNTYLVRDDGSPDIPPNRSGTGVT